MTQPLWVDTGEAAYPSLTGDIEADIAIVGAGFSGIGAAYALRDSGAEVIILEERTVASGASGRNAGFVLAGPALLFGEACAQLGTPPARVLWDLTITNNRLLAELVDEYCLDCGFLRRGSMSLAISRDEMALLEETAGCLLAAGIDACLVRATDLPRPFDRLYSGGLYYPGNAEMDPGAFLQGMAARIVEGPVRLYERTPVVALHSGQVQTLVTPGGRVRARKAILATNAYTVRLLPSVPIAPTRGQVLATRRLGQVVVPFPMYANYGYEYWRQTPDGRLVVGGWRNLDLATEIGMEERLHGDIQQALEAFCFTILGDRVPIERRWAGIMGFTPDLLPLVGEVPGHEGLYMAVGYSGHGVSMAFTCGILAAHRAAGEDVEIPASLDPARFTLTADDVDADLTRSTTRQSRR